MSPRTQTLLAWALFVITLGGVVAMGLLGGGFDPLAAAFLTMSLVGVLIVWRAGGNAVGWVMVAIGVAALISATSGAVADWAANGGPTGWAVAAALLGDTFFIATIVLTVVILPLIFPTGLPVSPRWTGVAWLAFAMVLANTVLVVSQPTLEGEIANQFGNEVLNRALEPFLEDVVTFGIVGAALAAALSLVTRFRRSTGVERKQLAWLTYAVALMAMILLVEEVAAALGVSVSDAVETASLVMTVLAFPIAIGVAVLRYRLYEIDRLIRRTVSYAVLAVLLAVAYVGAVSAIGSVVGRQNPLAVAGATLAAAALFSPMRRRVQAWVDHRFDRARYDTEQVVEGFSARLRDEIDLDGLTTDLSTVMWATLRPATMSLVLVREEAR
jgi:MFS family permease